MGVLEFFGTLIKNNITSSSIKSNFRKKMPINHLFLDFNSIIHVASQKVLIDINAFMKIVLKNIYHHRAVTNIVFNEQFEKFKMKEIQKQIKQNSEPDKVIEMFQNHFNEKYLDKMIITRVINMVLSIIRTFCVNDQIKTLLLAIDGVPSKGKMIEQRQRRYMGAVAAEYEKKILLKYQDYLLDQEDYIYLATKDEIRWSRNKITPGTGFMQLLVNYLSSDKIQEKFKINRSNMNIILSDMYQIGEGEKKIVNYINQYLPNTHDSIMVYSPDADVILLCILLPVQKLYMLRHNQQTSKRSTTEIYDLIDISLLKNNIAYYINNNPDFPNEKFNIDKINHDIVCISTLFGNDFVPKIETLDVKKGFQDILDAYLKTLIQWKHKSYYLVNKRDDKYQLNFTFLKSLLKHLLPEENDFIIHNNLYTKYITIGQIKNVFNYREINNENLIPVFQEFRTMYEELKVTFRQNLSPKRFIQNEQFMDSLKKSIILIVDDQPVNTTNLTYQEVINLTKDYFRKHNKLPRLNINLNTWSHSINDYIHKKHIHDEHMNDYQIEVYQFQQMLDQYYLKLNAQPLQLTTDRIGIFYQDYFGVKLFNKDDELTKNAKQIMHHYLEGLVWVFNYYFNDRSYVNYWYYQYERAPLLTHLLIYLESIDRKSFRKIQDDLDTYQVNNLDLYFNPLEQLVYVSPMTPGVLKLLPNNYRKYIKSDHLDPFLKNFFIDINLIVQRMWKEKVSSDVNCRSVIYFNKCHIKSITKPTKEDDMLFLTGIRKIKPSEISIKRSQIDKGTY